MTSQTEALKKMVHEEVIKKRKASNLLIEPVDFSDGLTEYRILSYEWYEIAWYSPQEKLALVRNHYNGAYSPSTGRQISNLLSSFRSWGIDCFLKEASLRTGNLVEEHSRVQWDAVRAILEKQKEDEDEKRRQIADGTYNYTERFFRPRRFNRQSN